MSKSCGSMVVLVSPVLDALLREAVGAGVETPTPSVTAGAGVAFAEFELSALVLGLVALISGVLVGWVAVESEPAEPTPVSDAPPQAAIEIMVTATAIKKNNLLFIFRG